MGEKGGWSTMATGQVCNAVIVDCMSCRYVSGCFVLHRFTAIFVNLSSMLE